uniref:Mediator of RNA polymerase II transcription subunit 15a isoform X2 n=1 Tax=Elaeis guineensis var. tenera TaxID=51953 RepID=A0A8N4F2A8_ELAGV|nr:mediator of RNA polymerase II transcription subunit 15a isoform X2 [Elaeis guineensis]
MEGSSRNPSAEGSSHAGTRTEGSSRTDARPTDWRSLVNTESRQRVIAKIMNSLKKHLPPGASEGLNDLQRIAVRFEEKVYAAATSQYDYLRRISSKLLSMEMRAQNGVGINFSPSVLATGNQNLAHPESSPIASLGIQSQVSSERQSLVMSHVNQSPVLPPLLPQNHQHKATSATTPPGSANLARSSVSGFSEYIVANTDQTSHFQNISSVSQNSINSSTGQSLTPKRYANVQRQTHGRQRQQQTLIAQQHQQQSQNTFVYQHQHQQQILKQNVSHPSSLQSQIQQQLQQQQQTLLHPDQMKSSQQPLMQMASSLQSGQSMVQQMQPTMTQSVSQSNLQKNHIQQCLPSSLKQHPQSVARQKKQSQPIIHQQSSSLQQESTSVPQQSILSSSQKLMRQHSSISDMQQSKLLGRQNSALDIQQQQQRLPGQKNSLLSIQQALPESSQQIISLHQQQQLRLQSNISGLKPQLQPQQQQQQQQIFGSHSSAPNMQQNPCTVCSPQRTKAVTEQQIQQPTIAFVQSQGRLSQYQLSQEQLMSQVQSQPSRLQQQLDMHQQSNSLQQEMQQRPQSSGALLQPQNLIEEQRQYIQSQRGLPEATSNTQNRNAGVVDWQEEIYQEIMSWKKYSTELNELNGKVILKIEQLQHEGVNPATKQSERLHRMKIYKSLLDAILHLLPISKSNINSDVKRKFPYLKKYMRNFKNLNMKRSVPSEFQGRSQSMPQHLPSQVSQLQQHDDRVNEVQQINLQCLVASMQSAAAPSMQHGSMHLSMPVHVPTAQQNMANTLQPTPRLDPTKQGSLDSMQQGTVGLVQQDGVGSLQTAISASQQPHLKQQHHEQQQQLFQTQQMKQQFQQHQMQLLLQKQQKQQLIQQPPPMQLHQQQKQQQVTHLPPHQMPQHPKNDVNELKGKQSSGIKSGLYQQHCPAGQHHNYTSPDGCEANVVSTTNPGQSNAKEQPIERLINVVQSLSPKKLSSPVRDMRSVIRMIDGNGGLAPGNDSRVATGDLTAIPLNVMPSAGSMNDSSQQSYELKISGLESTATSNLKRQKVEVNHALLEEINEINQKLIDMVITLSEDADVAAAAVRGEGTVVKCSFNAAFLCPNLKSHFASDQMPPIMPLRFLIPTNYPKSSPVILDMVPSELSKEFQDLSVNAWSRFRISLRDLPQPLSLREIVKTWDACARKVIEEYAQQNGGGSFSSRFGAWENCVSA